MSLMASAFATVFLRVFQPQHLTRRQSTLAALTSARITLTPLALIPGVTDGSLVDRADRSVGGMLGVLATMKPHEGTTHEGTIRGFGRKNARGNRSQGEATRIAAGLAPVSDADYPQESQNTGQHKTEEINA